MLILLAAVSGQPEAEAVITAEPLSPFGCTLSIRM